jgi:hypothetical protein
MDANQDGRMKKDSWADEVCKTNGLDAKSAKELEGGRDLPG